MTSWFPRISTDSTALLSPDPTVARLAGKLWAFHVRCLLPRPYQRPAWRPRPSRAVPLDPQCALSEEDRLQYHAEQFLKTWLQRSR